MHIEKSIIMKNYLVTNDYFKTTLPMIKYVTSLPIPLRLCKLSKSNPNLQLSYCKNRGLIHAISLIGKYKGFQSRKSAYKRGIDYLYHALNNDDNNHFHHILYLRIKCFCYMCKLFIVIVIEVSQFRIKFIKHICFFINSDIFVKLGKFFF